MVRRIRPYISRDEVCASAAGNQQQQQPVQCVNYC